MGGSQGEPLFSYKVLPVDNYTGPTGDNYESNNFDQDLHSGYNACQPQVCEPLNLWFIIFKNIFSLPFYFKGVKRHFEAL